MTIRDRGFERFKLTPREYIVLVSASRCPLDVVGLTGAEIVKVANVAGMLLPRGSAYQTLHRLGDRHLLERGRRGGEMTYKVTNLGSFVLAAWRHVAAIGAIEGVPASVPAPDLMI